MMQAHMPHEINVADEPQECEQLEAFLSQKCGHSVKIRVPKRGEKLKQCELAKMNAAQTLARSRELAHREWERTEGALAEALPHYRRRHVAASHGVL